ncbi:redox-sensitive transcriptional activator SoxR [Nocardioides sp. AX2bis]|uniref:redox-sensitive transcriptional activator SoxR n=1 Tax=Nocardioides sp. AX2bis TaxID=2653157 RepID=UPI001F2CD5FA|nr:redox-sensitive transcriptional activator SoxR [Nocardioides sp. AX2bis]
MGAVAERAGLSTATLRFYEDRGLIQSTRTTGNQRRYPRHVLRRLAFVTAAQRVGLTLSEIRELLDTLPSDTIPTQDDWAAVAAPWRELVAARIRTLERLQTSLDECIGCGCLSLTRCSLINQDDAAATEGPGSRWVRRAEEAGRRRP